MLLCLRFGEVVDRTPVVNDNEGDNRYEKQYDSYYRILAVVYVDETNLNKEKVREGKKGKFFW
nr:hypothetical protein BSM_10640 [uncultured archaeon]